MATGNHDVSHEAPTVGSVVERKVMSLLINSRNNLVTRNAIEPVVVPSASVWDVERGYGSAVRSTANSWYVRTLRVEDCTTYRSNRTSTGRSGNRSNRGRNSVGESNTGNYALGAVFGVAVFVGTLLGGLASTEGNSAPQPPASNVQQVEAAVTR